MKIRIRCLLLFLSFLTSGCYVTRQAYRQTQLFLGREPLEDQTGISQDTKDWIRDVLKEASELGLNVGSSYGHVVFPRDNAVAWSVSAAYPFELKSYTWWFPFVGEVPYKGFYDRHERDEEARELEKKGFDVHLSRVAAFSSLGWFPDPLFPSMLELKPFDLAHLLFHELTHRTFWIQGGVDLNENMAEFIAEKATLGFLKKSGLEPDPYLKSRQFLERTNDWQVSLEADLRALYSQKDLAPRDMKLRKDEIFKSHLDQLRVDHGHRYDLDPSKWNNARVLAGKTYLGRQSEIQQKYDCFGSLRVFIESIKQIQSLTDLKTCSTKLSRASP
jgi:predicted aminopeptidase